MVVWLRDLQSSVVGGSSQKGEDGPVKFKRLGKEAKSEDAERLLDEEGL